MGGYVDRFLLPSEEVKVKAKLHWFHWLPYSIIFLLLTSPSASASAFALLSPLLLVPVIRQFTNEFAITDRRVVFKAGLVSRYIFEMNLDKIETVRIHQSIPGRLFNFGTISVVGSGGSSKAFNYIAKPMDFRRAVYETEAAPPHAALA